MARLLCVYGARMVYDAGMVTNFVGIQRDFTVVAGTRADVGIRVIDADGADVNVGVCTWKLGIWRDGAEPVAERFGELLPNPAGARVSDLFWRFPVLEAGLWRYELVATDSEGEAARVFYGVIGSREASDIVEGSPVIGVKGWRMLEAQLPVEAGGKLQARWLAGEYVLALCEVARGHAVNAEASAAAAAGSADAAAASAERAAGIASGMQGALDNAVGLVTQRAEEAAERAEDAAVRAESAAGDAEEYAEAVIEKFNETDEFIEAFWDRAFSVIVPSSSTGTWVIGGKDTGEFYRGANGLSPVVGENGNWLTWSWDSGTWEDSGTRAEGKNGFSPYINGAGYWVYIDPLSGRQVTGDMAGGRDGIDGVTVRRILVDSYDDIPQSGDTCNGGFYYYVRGWKQTVTANRVLVFVKQWVSMSGDGVLITGENGNPGLYPFGNNVEATVRDINLGSSPVIASVVDEQTFELASKSGEDLLFEASSAEAAGLMVYDDFEEGRGYDVYAWLESDGVGSWVNVGLANDLATAEVYGLMKYGTDKVVSYGAPVGQNPKGQATVPVADLSLPGAVRPTTQIDPLKDDPDAGGGTHMGSSGKMLVDKATPARFGAMKHSFNRRIGFATNPDTGEEEDWGNTNCLGVQADDSTSVQIAGAFQWGVVRSGTSVRQSNGMPWILPVGMAAKGVRNEYGQDIRGQLMNNLLKNGALRTMVRADWLNNLPPGMTPEDVSGGNAFGLLTSDSFKQSRLRGLELMPATDELLGGVKVMETLGSGTAVPTGTAVVDYLDEHYYTKDEVYTQAETVAQIRAIVPDVISGMLAGYATQSWTANRFVSYDVYNGWKNNITGIVDQIREDLDETTAEVAANKQACENAVASLTATVRSNKAACDNSVAQLNGKIAALEDKTDGYVKQGNSGIEEIWVGTAEEFAKVSLSGKKWYLVLEN